MRLNWDRIFSILLIVPSVIAIAIFVYGFIGWTGWVSLSNWDGLRPDLSWAGVVNYIKLFSNARFQIDIRNTIVFTLFFLGASMGLGLGLAILLDQGIRGENIFRSLFLFPMSISFIVTGVAWRWLLAPGDPATGRITGINVLLEKLNLPTSRWYTDPTVLYIRPESGLGQTLDLIGLDFLTNPNFGLPLAMFSIVLAATWQMSGFVMAMYLAGLRGISEELREAARIDGASEWNIYRHIILPLLKPITLSVVIVLGHISLKIFDLVAAMSKKGPGFATDVPAYFMFETTFQGDHYSQGASIAIFMLISVSLLIVPYLVYSTRTETKV
ncbi:MAG: sugar ABC transporter permease [Proteobacteria bacterium]|nr:sugar ABC transporter permease [Pseudomonadota bacterium]